MLTSGKINKLVCGALPMFGVMFFGCRVPHICTQDPYSILIGKSTFIKIVVHNFYDAHTVLFLSCLKYATIPELSALLGYPSLPQSGLN